MDESLQSKASVIMHLVVALVVGFVSIRFEVWLSFFIGIVVLFAIGYLGDFLFGKKGFKWWLSNGLVVYIFIWIVSWIYFFNTIL